MNIYLFFFFIFSQLILDEPDWNHENLKLGLIPGQNYQSLNLEMTDDDGASNSSTSQDHNLSINEAALLRTRTPKKKLKFDTGFSICELSELHQDSLQKIQQDLVKIYWGCV